MKNRWALRLAALTLISCLAMSGVSLAVEPGSASDPLVTLSYLNDVFLGQIMTKVDQKIAARNSQLLQQSGGAGGMSGVEFAVVTLSKGQVLTGDIGCEVMLRVGTASCVSPSNPGLIDETTAASLNNGGALAANHLYMMTIEGRGVKASYFVESEQIPTACGLGVLVDRDRSVLRAGGYLIQLLPGAPEGIIDRLEKGIMAAGPVTNLLMENDDPESLLRRVMADFELEILETVPVEYRCYCSRERMTAALVSLGRKQLTELAEDPNGIELTCQFCDSRQRFTPEEIRELLEKASEA